MSEENESKRSFSQKDQLQKTLYTGIHGKPQLKKEEKNRYLGEFRERVIKALTFRQIHEESTYTEILTAIRHPKAKKLKVSRKADLKSAREYINLAKKEGLSFTTVDSPHHKGPIRLVVVSDEAVNIENIMIKSRHEKLKSKGIPEEVIDAIGEKICNNCYGILEEKSPEEVENYDKLSYFDRMLGEQCFACNK